jgi:hypothetical protein
MGETAHLYWKLRTKECEFLKKAKITDVKIRKWKDMKDDLELALADGFDSLSDFKKWFARYDPNDDTEFMIIRWDGGEQ